ncbi:hypothetical protein M422DRAFT_256715 [Sphaerobolus stellatus SS14]|uniref:Non-specific serine/threonine protein kinase n=1 Tax=Sphaerobolus stellatus (strain SS14) TaxID=990650 RepID=A0A0C9VRA3_SPHS4|nr:hypothetical protein M422DRAFT_256715 [Sphaerobolus stellatus SS14]
MQALLKQLLLQQCVEADAIKKLKEAKSKSELLRKTDLQTLLTAQLHHLKGFIIIDAFDEISQKDVQTGLLNLFKQIVSKIGVKVLLMSRPHIKDIMDIMDLKADAILEITATPGDIQRFIEAQLKVNNISNLREKGDLEEKVITGIQKKSSGIFLLAKLHMITMQYILRKGQYKKIISALENLHDNFSKTYENVLERIAQNPEDGSYVHWILSWILCAHRPLSMEELQCALDITEGGTGIDHKDFMGETYIISVCQGLVVIGKESGIVSIVHETAYEWLNQNMARAPFLSEAKLAKACLSFLDTNMKVSKQQQNLVQNLLFTSYASGGWHRHILKMEQDNEVIENCCKLLLDNDKLPVIVKLLEKYRRWSEDYWDTQTKAFHICARLGLDKVLEYILYEAEFREYGPNMKDMNGNTPLAVAIMFGKVNVVQVLLDSGRVDIGTLNAEKQTPLHLAAQRGNIEVTQGLLKTGKIWAWQSGGTSVED